MQGTDQPWGKPASNHCPKHLFSQAFTHTYLGQHHLCKSDLNVFSEGFNHTHNILRKKVLSNSTSEYVLVAQL